MLLRSRRVVIDGVVQPAAIEIRDGVITAILPFESVDIPVTEAVILPGLVDTHVHINEPGRTHWEGFETATRAAAAGGVTTLVDMPLDSIPATTTVAAYEQKLASTEGKLHVNTGFWGGVVPGNTSELEPLWRAGVFGFKCFLVPSGVDEFCHVSEDELREAMPVLARLGAPLLVHAESPSYLPLRPPESECDAISMMIRLSRETGARVHIVHLAAIEALPLIEQAQAEGVRITVETCPHYVFFEPAPRDNILKCAPPIRGRLRDALPRIGMVVSDHSPSPPEMKSGPYGNRLGRHRVARTRIDGDGHHSWRPRRSCEVDGRSPRQVSGPRQEGPHRARIRCRFRFVRSRRDLDRRAWQTASAPQNHTLCRSPIEGARAGHLPWRRENLR